jgi:hypothetical protein
MLEYGRSQRSSEPLGVREIQRKDAKPKPVVSPPPQWTAKSVPTVNDYGMRQLGLSGQVWQPREDELKDFLAAKPWMGDGDKKGDIDKAYTRLSDSMSAELPKPYARIYSGLRPSQTAIALHDVALSNPTRSAIYSLRLLKDQLLPQTVTNTQGINPIQGMPVSQGSPVYAVADALGTSSYHLRGAVIDTAIAKLAAEELDNVLANQPITSYLVAHQLSRGELAAALAQTQNWTTPVNLSPGDAKQTESARDFALRLIATHLNRPIEIHVDGGRSFEYLPFSDTRTNNPVRIKLTWNNVNGTPTMTFRRQV